MHDVLNIIEKNARLSIEDIAIMTKRTPQQVAQIIDDAEKDKIINGYRTLIDWEKTDAGNIQAIIELKVTPRRDCGFDEIATQIAEFEEVDRVLLMSGGYDLSILVTGKCFQDVAMFVAKRLSPIEGILSTATHFILRTYKRGGVMFDSEIVDERERTL